MIKPLYIKSTESTAEFIFDNEKQIFQMSGSSMPENAKKSFDPVLLWVKEYGINPDSDSMNVDFKFKYFNTSSTRKIMAMFEILESLQSKEFKILIRWYYSEGDERMLEEGEGFEELCDLKFEFIKL